MSTEQNKTAYLKFNEEVVNNGNVGILSDFLAANYVFHRTPEIKGSESMKQYFIGNRTTFPDWHNEINHIFAEGNMVAVFATESGTFKGSLWGIAPTGRKFSVSWASLNRFENGKLVETWFCYNVLSLFQQLGIPVPTG